LALMSLREYARHRGCYPRAVEVAIAAGRIQRDEQGRIESGQADIDWEANTAPHRAEASRRSGARGQAIRRELEGRAPKTTTESDSPPPETKTPTELGAYARARAQREEYAAECARLDLEKRQGKLIDRQRVESAATEFYRVLRDTVLAVPDRIPELAGEQRTLLETELRNIFERACRLEEHLKKYAS
jgi:hypothetical protein